jgi:chromatin segregation and condensation protein Rec8/ScpA/Scc1 (kleisin family)
MDLDDVSLFDLLCALREVLSRYDREHPPALLVERETFSVRDELLRLLSHTPRRRPLNLLRDLRQRSCRGQAIAAFLAVLEMLRLGLARLHQAGDGGILLYRTKRELQAGELEAIHP